MRYSKGVMWLDDCRIPFVDGKDIPQATTQRDSEEMNHKTKELLGYEKWGVGMELDVKRVPYEQNQQGRFTPNLLVCDDMLNDGSVSKSQRGRNDVGKPTYTGNSLLNSKTTMNNTDRGFDDKGTNSRYYDLDKWFDKVIDEIQ
jgi:hypothetical protein